MAKFTFTVAVCFVDSAHLLKWLLCYLWFCVVFIEVNIFVFYLYETDKIKEKRKKLIYNI